MNQEEKSRQKELIELHRTLSIQRMGLYADFLKSASDLAEVELRLEGVEGELRANFIFRK